MLKGPVARGKSCVLEFGDVHFEVTPAAGGRVVSVRLGSFELLAGPDVHPSNYGSTFWTSPQSDWDWPPLEELDAREFDVSTDERSFTLLGPKIEASSKPNVHGLSVVKKFTAEPERSSVRAEYTIVNHGTDPKRQIAPWEITRVSANGLTFYGADLPPWRGNRVPIVPTTTLAGCYWFRHIGGMGEAKLFSDGRGWLAHLSPENLLLVKTFPDVPAHCAVPGEAEIEIYSNAHYVEVENQGIAADIPAGGTLSWTVRWHLFMLPSNLKAAPGEALASFVQQVIR